VAPWRWRLLPHVNRRETRGVSTRIFQRLGYAAPHISGIFALFFGYSPRCRGCSSVVALPHLLPLLSAKIQRICLSIRSFVLISCMCSRAHTPSHNFFWRFAPEQASLYRVWLGANLTAFAAAVPGHCSRFIVLFAASAPLSLPSRALYSSLMLLAAVQPLFALLIY